MDEVAERIQTAKDTATTLVAEAQREVDRLRGYLPPVPGRGSANAANATASATSPNAASS